MAVARPFYVERVAAAHSTRVWVSRTTPTKNNALTEKKVANQELITACSANLWAVPMVLFSAYPSSVAAQKMKFFLKVVKN
jgi:hypothetical protein